MPHIIIFIWIRSAHSDNARDSVHTSGKLNYKGRNSENAGQNTESRLKISLEKKWEGI